MQPHGSGYRVLEALLMMMMMMMMMMTMMIMMIIMMMIMIIMMMMMTSHDVKYCNSAGFAFGAVIAVGS